MALSMWNSWSKSRKGKPVYDQWLDEYLGIINQDDTILDLGCGNGANTLYLIERRYQVLSVDYALEALQNVKDFIAGSQTLHVDMRQLLPFNDNQFSTVIADISLHYLKDHEMKQIMNELKRIMKPRGYLLARVSSSQDFHGFGKEIEPRYYDFGSYGQRYFVEEDLKKYFSILGDVEYKHTKMMRDEPFYLRPKYLYQIKVVNTKEREK